MAAGEKEIQEMVKFWFHLVACASGQIRKLATLNFLVDIFGSPSFVYVNGDVVAMT